MLRDRELPAHTTEVWALTSLTVEAWTALVPPCEAAVVDDMATWTLQGRRRQARRETTDQHGPLPTAEDRLVCLVVYLKQHPMPLRHGRVVGLRQSQATPWMHVVLPVFWNALRALGEAPSRRVETWCPHLGVEVPPLPREASPAEEIRAAPPPVAPLVGMTGPSDPCPAPRTRLNSNRTRAASTSGLGAKTSCCSRPPGGGCS
jgi:hypothetical protein